MTVDATETVPAFKMHDKWSVGIAAFLGSPLAGGVLLWRNYTLVDRREDGRRALWMSAAGTLALIILGFLLPDWIARIARPICVWGPAWILYGIADSGDPRHFFETHLVRGGQRASRWVAVGTGLGVLAGLLVALIVVGLLLSIIGYEF